PVLQGDTTVVVGVPFEWYGDTYPESGDYPHTFENASYLGCDSTVMLHLTVLPSLPGDTTVVTCEPFEWYGDTYPETGDYPHTIEGGSCTGNDSIVVLHLTVIPVLPGDTTMLTCEPFEWYGETYPESGDYTHVLENASYLGCDSIVTLHLTIEPVLQGDTTVVVGVPFEWYGQTYPESGDYPHTFEDGSYLGCDSTVMLHLTVLPSLPGDTTVVTCEPFEWYGETYPETGDYPHTIEGGSCTGNDSIVVLHLTVIPVLPGDTTMLTCEPFEWYGETYPESGDYTHVLENASYLGCDSIVTLHLTIEPVLQGDTTVVVGVPFEWYGQTYPESGDYPHTFEDGSYLGCDSTVMLHLTVLPSLPGDTTVVTCEPFEWYGETYSESGDYPHVFEGGGYLGNDSTLVLHLMIIPVLPGDTTMLTCESFEWYGEEYEVSGEYTHVFENASYLGCDSIVTLHLTIEPVLQGDTLAIACESFEWYGEDYDTSGDYTHVFEDGSYLGCDSIVTLHLTINHGTHETFWISECEYFNWHGFTCYTTGVYTYEYDNDLGCPSVDTLYLTIEEPYYDTIAMTACEYYGWYGHTYTDDGFYDHVIPGPVCDSTIVLNLTVVNEFDETITITACDDYEWLDSIYYESGYYTDTLVSQHGCDSIIRLDLTIINPDIHILGYSDVYYASDLWHGIYNYYVVDSTDVDLGPIEWECTDPDWLIMQVSNFHCILVVRTMGTATLTAHATTLSGCDDLLSMDISSTEFTKEDEVTEVLMFPNPALTEVTIQAPNLTNLQIINTMGQVVKTIKPDHNDETTVGLLDLSVGVYVVEITTSDGIFMERLIISR
ncbi:MAG: T9SS type A sorting domain-containing protein, partial [Bacteroidales bacterium]|nr:T9SS type A sorting domain-containing protein [Bacteroidales bacterium]